MRYRRRDHRHPLLLHGPASRRPACSSRSEKSNGCATGDQSPPGEPVRTLPQSTQALGAFGPFLSHLATSLRWGEARAAGTSRPQSPTSVLGHRASWLIAAEGIFTERIAGGGEGPRTRAATAVCVLAAPTAAMEDLGAPERAEEARVPIEHDRIAVPHGAGGQREEARRPHFTRVGDEHDAVAVAHAGSMPDGATRHLRHTARGAPAALDHHAPDVRRLGRRHDRPRPVTQIEQLLEELVALLRGDGLEHGASSHGHEEEETPAGRAELGGPPIDR